MDAPDGGVAAAAKDGAPAAGGDEKKQPVGIQVEEKIMQDMQNALSTDCRKRYSAMIAGEGPAMHTFDQHGDEAEESAKCEKALEGHLCHTVALITENKAVPDGRQMATNVKVEGKSCLPKECSNQNDLQVLSAFMRQQSKEVMPGKEVKVNLHVDCSASGGGVVEANEDGAADPSPAEKTEPHKAALKKSGAAPLLGFGSVVIILLGAMP